MLHYVTWENTQNHEITWVFCWLQRYHLSTASRVAWPQPTRSGGPLSDRKTVAMSDCQLVQPSRFGGVGFSLPGVETWLVSSKIKSWRRYYSIGIVKFLGMEFRFGLFSSSLAGCFLLQSLNEIGEWDGSSYQKGARMLWSQRCHENPWYPPGGGKTQSSLRLATRILSHLSSG